MAPGKKNRSPTSGTTMNDYLSLPSLEHIVPSAEEDTDIGLAKYDFWTMLLNENLNTL